MNDVKFKFSSAEKSDDKLAFTCTLKVREKSLFTDPESDLIIRVERIYFEQNHKLLFKARMKF